MIGGNRSKLGLIFKGKTTFDESSAVLLSLGSSYTFQNS